MFKITRNYRSQWNLMRNTPLLSWYFYHDGQLKRRTNKMYKMSDGDICYGEK